MFFFVSLLPSCVLQILFNPREFSYTTMFATVPMIELASAVGTFIQWKQGFPLYAVQINPGNPVSLYQMTYPSSIFDWLNFVMRTASQTFVVHPSVLLQYPKWMHRYAHMYQLTFPQELWSHPEHASRKSSNIHSYLNENDVVNSDADKRVWRIFLSTDIKPGPEPATKHRPIGFRPFVSSVIQWW